MKNEKYQVVIIGAGAAGLQAAHHLITEHGMDPAQILIVEARDRIGGRIHTTIEERKDVDGKAIQFPVDHGAAWVHGTGLDWKEPLDDKKAIPESNPMMKLLEKVGIHEIASSTTADVYDEHLHYVFDGNLWTRPRQIGHEKGQLVIFDSGTMLQNDDPIIKHALNRHERLLKKVSEYGEELYNRGDGMETARVSFRETIDKVVNNLDLSDTENYQSINYQSSDVKDQVEHVSNFYQYMVECWKGASLDGLQLSEFIEKDPVADGYTEQGDFYGPHCTLKHGMKTVLGPLLRDRVSERVVLNVEVMNLAYRDGTICLTTSTGRTIESATCICTIPIGCLLKKVESNFFQPPLSEPKQEALQHSSMGSYRKVLLTFDDIFWPRYPPAIGLIRQRDIEKDLLGHYLLLNNLWAKDGIPCIEAILCGPPGARTTGLSTDAIRDQVLQFLEDSMGLSNLQERCVGCNVTRWEEDPFSCGAFSYQPVGGLERFVEELRRPEYDGRFVFAGEATVYEYHGSVYAALFSGLNASEAVSAFLEKRCDYTGMFEGPEKTLEVVFRRVDEGPVVIDAGGLPGPEAKSDASARREGLRRLPRRDIDHICARARCTILSCVSNNYLDAYVLSESSLFVYPYLLVLKTCGTTTLLRCIGTLIELGRKVGLEIDWVGYSRKNFNFPVDQMFPHQSFNQELDYLYGHRSLCERLDGNGYTLGPVTGDHWFVFVADQTIRSLSLEVDTDRVLNIMMFDIDENVAKLFYYDQYERNKDGETNDEEVARISREQTNVSGINALCPGAIIDPRAFEPCGYSMNAILFRSYSTIHITPEAGSSYASFETNQKVGSYKGLISNVIRTFRPKRFVMTLMADEYALKMFSDNPLTDLASQSKIMVPPTPGGPSKPMYYKRSSASSIKVEEDCCCLMGNWILDESPQEMRAGKARGVFGESSSSICSAVEEEDPNLHWMTYDVGDGEQKVKVYVDPPIESYYQGNPPASTAVTPDFKGYQAKFINMSNKHVYLNWISTTGQKVELRVHKPFQSTGSSSFPGHLFTFTEKGKPDNELIRWTVKEYPENIYVYDPYTVEGDSVATEKNLKKLSKEDRGKWTKWHKTLLFNEHYRNFTGRSYLANYLRDPPMHFMWRADYFGQEHWVTSREVPFVETPPASSLAPITTQGTQRITKESDPFLLSDYRSKEPFVNMTLKVLSCQPRVFEIQNFLSPVEVAHILDLASKENLALSTTGDGKAVKDTTKTRTSYNSWVERERSPIIDVIYRRSADLMRIDEALLRFRTDGERPDAHDTKPLCERLQLVHYDVKQEYTAHHDFGFSDIDAERQGSRFATLLFYLNDGMVGGETSFPRWVNAETFKELKVKPEAGKAVLFYSQLPDGNLDDFSQHAAKPILKGEKMLINLWTHDGHGP